MLAPWGWRCVLLCVLLALAGPALAQPFLLERLDADPPAAEVLAGCHDAGLRPSDAANVLFEQARQPRWWRVTTPSTLDAAGNWQLVLETPSTTRVDAWVPGADTPVRRALFGEDRDDRYSLRALVFPLPNGLQPDQAIWLRVDAAAGYPMQVSLATRDAVHRADLRYIAWRASVLTAFVLLVTLALGFWVGTGDRSYGYLAAMLLSCFGYVASLGGEARWIPGLEPLLAASPQVVRMFAFLGTIASNLFLRRFLDMPRQLPWSNRALLTITAVLAAMAVLNLFSSASFIAVAGNVLVIASALVVIVGSTRLALRGDRPAILLFLSWIPLLLLASLRAGEVSGLWTGPAWLGDGLVAGFVIAGLLITLGLADKLLELRRDRDRASREASVDALTGGLSRKAIEQRLREEITLSHATGRDLTVAFIDIDHFKRVNDTHGHHVGDACLRYIGQRVRNRLRAQDLVGRYGGDELLAVMPDAGLQTGAALAEQLRAAVNCRPLSIDGLLVEATLSIGMAQLRKGETMRDLLARADKALYAGKKAGRDRVIASESPEALAKPV